jgi:hypothetical protein
MAISESELKNYKEALAYEKKNYAILQERVGDNDLKTIESNIWLKQFTAKAVQIQIESKKAQRDITSQLSQIKLENLKNMQQTLKNTTGNSSMISSVGTSRLPMGNRDVNEILSFINGHSLNNSLLGKSVTHNNGTSSSSSSPSSSSNQQKIKKKKKLPHKR